MGLALRPHQRISLERSDLQEMRKHRLALLLSKPQQGFQHVAGVGGSLLWSELPEAGERWVFIDWNQRLVSHAQSLAEQRRYATLGYVSSNKCHFFNLEFSIVPALVVDTPRRLPSVSAAVADDTYIYVPAMVRRYRTAPPESKQKHDR